MNPISKEINPEPWHSRSQFATDGGIRPRSSVVVISRYGDRGDFRRFETGLQNSADVVDLFIALTAHEIASDRDYGRFE